MAKETNYCVVEGIVVGSFFNSEGSSFKIELTTEKPTEFIKDSYSNIAERFLPEILTKDTNTLSFHSRFSIPTLYNETVLSTDKIGVGSKIKVKLKGKGNGMYPVAIIVNELVETDQFNPFDF